jgi:hypothetical protein
VFALLPLTVLIGGMALTNLDRYIYGFHYDRSVYSSFNFDLGTLNRKLRSFDKSASVLLVVTPEHKALYSNYAAHQHHVKRLLVSTDPGMVKPDQTAIVEQSLHRRVQRVPSDIVVSRTAEQADRFYLYKKIAS